MAAGAAAAKLLGNPSYHKDRKGTKMAKSDVRVIVTLECTECKRRNYTTQKNKREHKDRMELKKYCPFERKHTVHRETR